MEHLWKCGFTEPWSQDINEIEKKKKLVRKKVFGTYYPMATVINRDETRFTALAFNRNNSREIMQRAQFDGSASFSRTAPFSWFSSALWVALIQSTPWTRLENWFGVKCFSLLSYFKLWLFLWYCLFVLLGCLRGKHEGRSVSSHALSWPYCFHLFYSWENKACLWPDSCLYTLVLNFY